MLFALDAGAGGESFDGSGRFAVDLRNSLDAERLELLDCVQQELKRGSSAPEKPSRAACFDLLTHLAGGSVSGLPATVQ